MFTSTARRLISVLPVTILAAMLIFRWLPLVLLGCTMAPTCIRRRRTPCSAIRAQGVYIDAQVTMNNRGTLTVRSCFAALRQIRSVHRSLPRHALLTLIRALVVSKVDYCMSALVGITGHLMDKLQSILNAAALLVLSVRKSQHITPPLRELHWLRVLHRILFRLCVLDHRCLHGSAPAYLAERVHRTTKISPRRCLRSVDKLSLIIPSTRCSTLGDREFPLSACRACNSLSNSMRKIESLESFRRKLKNIALLVVV